MIKKLVLIFAILFIIPNILALETDDSLIAYYNGSSNNLVSGQYNLTFNNGASISSSNCLEDNCYFTDGSDDFIDLGFKIDDLSSPNSNEYTLSIWVDPIDLNGHVLGSNDGSVGAPEIYIQNDDFLGLYGTPNLLHNQFTNLNGLGYIHLVMVANGTGGKIYYNGTKVDEGAVSFSYATTNLMIGGRAVSQSGAAMLNGYYDEVSIWNRSLSDSEVLSLYNDGIEGLDSEMLTINLVSPTDLTNYTFDIESFDIQVSSDLNASCQYQYLGINSSFTETGNTIHNTSFNMGTATNSTKQFDITVYCNASPLDNVTKSIPFTVFQQQVPLDFVIFVPTDQQTFDSDTQQIQFFIQTNYQSNCNYLVYNMSSPEPFSLTGTNTHKTNYTAFYPDIRTYNTTFTCEGTIVNETSQKNITFFLAEETVNSITGFAILSETTGQLPNVGSDIGNFMSNITPGVIAIIFTLSIIIVITAFVLVIGRGLRGVKL